MQKRKVMLLVALSLVPALVLAYPGFGGGKGLFRVQNALVEQEAGLTLSLHALARNPDFPGSPGVSGWIADLIAPEISYAPVASKYVGLELFGSWGGRFQLPDAPDGSFIWGFHDLKAGGKLSIPVLPVFKVGGTANYTFKGREDKEGWNVLDSNAIAKAYRLGWGALVTLQLQDVLPSAPNFIVNYGKNINKLSPAEDETYYGAGAELQGKGFALFVEALSQQPDMLANGEKSTGMLDTDNGHIHLTPGVAFGSAASSFLKLGYTFSFGGPADANGKKMNPNEIILGLGFATPFGARKPAAYGSMVCKVTDARTGAAIAANVKFPDDSKVAPFTVEPTGIFELKKLRTGVYIVEVNAEGYQPQAVPIEVKEGEVTQYDFVLRSLISYGMMAGTVVDAATGMPMSAKIAFPGSKLQSLNADAATGAFKVDPVEVGVYTVTASADKYIPSTVTLAVEDGKLATATFKLAPAATGVAVTGKVSDKKTGDPLAATVTFPDAGNAMFATDPATGVYKGQLMAGSYTVVVESKDYVKQTAAIVVEKDKPLVRDYAMLKVGMSITLKGIYFNTAKATIKPESRPALEAAAAMLKENPTINVEIQGHTDSQGSDEYNLTLSDKRAWAVVNYLVQNLGIDANRLTAKGYGESRPVGDNETADGRALNRRVEFSITGEK